MTMKTPDLTAPKSINWPLLSMQLRNTRPQESCSIRPIDNYDNALHEAELIKAEQEYMRNIVCRLIDMRYSVIFGEIIKAASEAGITDLYLMDKQFVIDALLEKLERDYHGKT